MKKKNCSPLFLGEIINIMWLKSTRKDIFALLNFINNKIQKRGWGLGGRGKGGKGGREVATFEYTISWSSNKSFQI